MSRPKAAGGSEQLLRAEQLRERGELAQARRLGEDLLRRNAADADALSLLAALAADEGDAPGGLRWVERALAADPGSAAAHYIAGRIYQAEGRLGEAEASYRRSLALAPGQPKAHNNLGCVLQMQSRLDEAIACFRRALELDPALAQANQNLASITKDPGGALRALEGYRRELARNPRDAELHTNFGNVCRELGLHREAIAAFAEAVRLAPGYAAAHFSLALQRLLDGDYAEGLEEFEWRWQVKGLGTPARAFAQPLWDGAPLHGRLFLHAEQGFGDTLNMIRYAALAAARAREVVVECQREVAGLVAGVRGISAVVPQGESLPAFDAHLPLMSLPRAFGTTLQSIPWDGPYLHVERSRADAWRAEVAGPGLRVGLSWAGQPDHWSDRRRSISLAALAPLAQVPGVRFYSLQKGKAGGEAARPPGGMPLVELGPRFADFSDTAAAISQLDLVISVDTAIAHLAAALGRPTWVLLALLPDWRYGLESERTPWYPTMRLFRQSADGDWAEVIARVAQALRATSRPLR